MISIVPKRNLQGVMVIGDYYDFYQLADSMTFMTAFANEEDHPYVAVRNELSEFSFDLRHAAMGDRGARLMENNMDKDKKRYFGLKCSFDNVYYETPFFWPNMIFVALAAPKIYDAARDAYGYEEDNRKNKYNLRLPAHLYRKDRANLDVFCASIWEALEEAIGKDVTEELFHLYEESDETYENYLSQYIEKLSCDYIKLPVEERKEALIDMIRKIITKSKEYSEMVSEFSLKAVSQKISIHQVPYIDDEVDQYFEEVVW